MPLRCRDLRKAHQLKADKPESVRNCDYVAFPEAAWFSSKAKKPFKAVIAHPHRRAPHIARVQIKSSTNPQHQRDLKLVTVLVHPSFLFWRTEPSPEHIG